MKAVINVYLKDGVLDPQGKAVHHALETHGFNGVKDVRVGKQIVIELNETNMKKAKDKAKEMAEELLANTVIEDYHIEIIK